MAGAALRPPGVTEFAAAYDIHVGGIWAGEVVTDAELGDDNYRATMAVRTRGIVGFFFDERWQGETVGRVEGRQLVPEQHRSHESEREIEVAFADGKPAKVHAEPEFNVKPWSIEASEQDGATDPVSALVALLVPAPADEICNQRIEAFDGRHRFAFELGEPQGDGEVIRCPGAFERIAGYKPKKVGEREPFTAAFKRRKDGSYQVIRVDVPVGYGGVAVMRLRD